MPRFSWHVDDDRHSPPSLRAIIGEGETRAQEWVRKLMGASSHIRGLLGAPSRLAARRRRPSLKTVWEAPATDMGGESPTAAAEVSPPRKSLARTWAGAVVDVCDFLLFLPLIPLMGRPEAKAVEPESPAAGDSRRPSKD